MQWLRYALIGQLVIGFVMVQIAVAQSGPTTDENARTIQRLERQVERLPPMEARVAVLEAAMFEIRWACRAVAAAVLGQLVMGVYASSRLRKMSGKGAHESHP